MPSAVKCSICKENIGTQYGHNAQPVADGRCCDVCNDIVVIPARIKDALKSMDKERGGPV